LFNCFYLCLCFPLVCIFVQLFLNVRVFSSKQEENTRTDKNNWTKMQIRGNRRTDRNNWTKVQTRGILSVRVFSSCMYLCSIVFICAFLPLVCTFVQLFLSVRVFSSCMHLCSIVFICAFVFLLFVPRTDINNWTKVHTRGKHTHR
jgi:hypothetical protein